MSCDNYPNAQDAQTFKQDMTTQNEIITSTEDLTNPASDGERKLTHTAIARASRGVDIGNYEQNTKIERFNEYVVYQRSTNPTLWGAKTTTALPYTVDSVTYPNPADDSNLTPYVMGDVIIGEGIGRYDELLSLIDDSSVSDGALVEVLKNNNHTNRGRSLATELFLLLSIKQRPRL